MELRIGSIGELNAIVINGSTGPVAGSVKASVVQVIQRDKVNMRRQIKSMSVQSSGNLKRGLNEIVDYENITIGQEIATKMDIEIDKNPAYSTVKDL